MKTVLNVKVDLKVKKEAQRVAKEMGLPMSIVVNNFLSNFIAEKQVIFTTREMSKGLEKRLIKVEKDTKQKKNISPVFSSMDDALQHLHSKQ